MDDEYQNFLAELGGTVPESATKQNSATLALGPGSSGTNPPWASSNNTTQAGLGSSIIKPKEHDETNLYIGYLPPAMDDDGLNSLFSPFGEIVMAKVIKDRLSGLSKGYGFVKYADVLQANNANVSMNGHRLDGRTIAVRVAGRPPQPNVPPGPPAPAMPTYPPNQPPGAYSSQQYNTSGPIGSAPPGAILGLQFHGDHLWLLLMHLILHLLRVQPFILHLLHMGCKIPHQCHQHLLVSHHRLFLLIPYKIMRLECNLRVVHLLNLLRLMSMEIL
ncbi:unnamed protein product [Fraxinus pennsylvanica]|uniref:RRM domain-containing protein n=1 Tax=Fraxinus pennsylvanica TaxID=56036 RepID=A0AAD2E2U3_9LAMI|nr:unnamed protein product [Fraxinus pennsylvanica]